MKRFPRKKVLVMLATSTYCWKIFAATFQLVQPVSPVSLVSIVAPSLNKLESQEVLRMQKIEGRMRYFAVSTLSQVEIY